MRSWELNGYSFSFDIYLSFLSTLTTFRAQNYNLLPCLLLLLKFFSFLSPFYCIYQKLLTLPSLWPPSCSSFSFYFPPSLTSILLPIMNSFIPLSHSPSLSFPPIFSHPNPLPTSLFLFLISLSNFYPFNQSTLTPSYFSANPQVLPPLPSISFLPLSPSHSLPIHLFTLPPSL